MPGVWSAAVRYGERNRVSVLYTQRTRHGQLQADGARRGAVRVGQIAKVEGGRGVVGHVGAVREQLDDERAIGRHLAERLLRRVKSPAQTVGRADH